MSLSLFINTSDNRVLNKTLTALSMIDCVFKDNTSMENPEVVISRDAYDARCNYVYLSDTTRYYYVTDVIFSKQSVIYKLKCDVLMSFKDSILSCDAIASRSATQYNNYITDPKLGRLQYSDIYLKKFPTSLHKNLDIVLVVGGA